MNQSFVMLKPDCIERELCEELIEDIKSNHFQIKKMEKRVVDETTILKHYQEVIERLNSDDFRNSILKAFVGKEVVIMEITNESGDAISKFRELIGPTDPSKAGKETIRGKYGNDSMEKSKAEKRMLNNLIHASDSEKSAESELALWFK